MKDYARVYAWGRGGIGAGINRSTAKRGGGEGKRRQQGKKITFMHEGEDTGRRDSPLEGGSAPIENSALDRGRRLSV